MPQKLFVLGLPGSGKSTVIRYIIKYIKRYHDKYVALHCSDYDILLKMFEQDIAHKHFFPTEHGGFYVKAPIVYDEALKQLEQNIEEFDYKDNELVLIEFARSDYIHALDIFSGRFLRGAFFLFLDVDIRTGEKRVKDRVKYPKSQDDHFVSRLTFEYYHQKDNAKYLLSVKQHLMKYGISSSKIVIHDNRGSPKIFFMSINAMIDEIVNPN